ncbi:NACHT domain-containing protein [Dactylosporangium matsuzakiense]|uniref:NACHT domain-containing protein n=1 Tax=Dactylosporangium matsuzakiense TaxID=53360 RepID=UPI0021C37A9A|nr:NACHT domain-containing protein [Dactylosporangium matsuzakiense]UWZ41426.1 NACHT domain-containing protein [Dactylosporangium matsuzakiense]
MEDRGRAHGWVAGGAAGVGLIVLLVFFGLGPERWLGKFDQLGSVGGLAVAVASLGLSGWSAAESARRRARDPAGPPAATADDLADQVARQWRTEAAARGLGQFDLIRVRWSATARSVGAPPADVLGSDRLPAAPARVTRLRLAGGVDELARLVSELPARQVVVIGEPGVGKSTLAVLLTLALLARRSDGDPVPVLLTTGSWDPRREHLDAFLVRRLGELYPSVRPGAALRLIDRGLLVPVLDGLDEMAGPVQALAVAALSEAIGRDRPLVLTSRAEEYERAVAGAGVQPARAAVVEIEPIGVGDAAAYLLGGRMDGAARWATVTEHLHAHPDGVPASVFRSPLMLYLARTAYRDTRRDPGELLGLAEPDQLEAHLLDAYLPAVYAPRVAAPGAVAARAPATTPDQATRWLTFLARHLDREDTTDLAWWRLRRATPRYRLLPGLAGGLLGGLMGGVVGWVVGGGAGGFAGGYASTGRAAGRRGAPLVMAVAVVLALAAGLAFGYGAGRWGSTVRSARSTAGSLEQLLFLAGKPVAALTVGVLGAVAGGLLRRLARPAGRGLPFVVAAGLAFGATSGTAYGLARGVDEGLAFGAVFGLVGALAAGLAGRIAAGREDGTPQRIATSPRRIAIGLLAGLASGAAVGAAFALVGGPAYGLVYGSVFGVLLGSVGGTLLGTNAPATLTEAVTPTSTLTADRRASLVIAVPAGLAYAAMSGFAGFRAGSVADGLVSGLGGVLGGLAVGLAFAVATGSWFAFIASVLFLAARRRLPLDLMAFLRDAHRRGVLRETGAIYQFRHVRLQQHLLATEHRR